jgi:predicted CxxxxCH...CXXCH cytochrome family protein
MARACVVLLVLSLASCSRTRLDDGLPATTDCTGCHGQKDDPTPPPAVNGSFDTHDIGVGAHATHMQDGEVSLSVGCLECHPMPMVADGTEHPDPLGRPATVLFGLIAHQGSANPVWDRKTRTCANTYCHGSTLRGAQDRPAPVWTQVDGSQLKCTACHGNPPGGTHPQDSQCEKCHGEVVAAGGVIKTRGQHVNGSVEVMDPP